MPLGTRFVATRESTAPEFYKQSLLEREADATIVTDAFSGQWARALRDAFAVEYRASGASTLPDADHFPMYSGQSVGLVHNVPGAAEVMETIVREAREGLTAMTKRIAL